MEPFLNERITILGASRGLGLTLAKAITSSSPPSTQLLLSSRKIQDLVDTSFYQKHCNQLQLLALDFTKKESLKTLHDSLREFQPHRLIYCAGGGPYGPFHKRPWHAHEWAMNLNLIFPSELLHSILIDVAKGNSNLQQILFIGSAIAESQADPNAASYASSKHGLKGLINSIINENDLSSPSDKFTLDIRLYSPGYMDTQLLPPHSYPRLNVESKVLNPSDVAQDILQWMMAPANESHWHRNK